MTLSSFFKGTFAAFIVFFAGDFLWHEVFFVNFYDARIFAINGAATPLGIPVFLIALEFLIAAGASYFILRVPGSMQRAILEGGLIGLMISGAVNFVNHSLILKWDLAIMLLDTSFGLLLGLLAGCVIFLAGSRK